MVFWKPRRNQILKNSSIMKAKQLMMNNIYTFTLGLFFVLYSATINGQDIKHLEDRAKEWIQNPQTGFIENHGQFRDENGNPVPDVLFKTSAPGLDVFISRKGIAYQFYERVESGEGAGQKEKKYRACKAVMLFDGKTMKAQSNAEVIPEYESGWYSNYYLPGAPEGILNVKTYKKITIKNIYKGIDWILYADGNKGIKYDLIVNPGADVSDIKLKYYSEDDLEKIDSRNFRINTTMGSIEEGGLVTYQNLEAKSGNRQSQIINASYKIEKHPAYTIVNFKVGDYDKSAPLIIDPPLTWLTYFGNGDYEGPMDLHIDNMGNIFVAGYSAYPAAMPVVDPGGGAWYQPAPPNDRNHCIILKFDNSETLVWATYYSGGESCFFEKVTTDASGNIYCAGHGGDNFPVLNAHQDSSNGNYEGVFVKFNANGVRQWATFYGGSGNEFLCGLDIDDSGNLYATGMTRSSDFPLVNFSGGYNQTYEGSDEAFLLRFNASGTCTWATCLGGTDNECAYGVTYESGKIYLTGRTSSANFPVQNRTGAFNDNSHDGSYDIYLSMFDAATGVCEWSTFYGGTDSEQAEDVKVDSSGNVLLFGKITSGTNFPVVNKTGAYNQAAFGGGATDLFIVQFDSAGVCDWATYFGGNDHDHNGKKLRMAIDQSDNLYITTGTSSDNMPLQDAGNGSYYHDTYTDGKDFYIASFDGNTRSLTWGTYLEGTTANEWGTGIGIKSGGDIYVTGEFLKAGISTVSSGGYHQPSFGGKDDGCMMKFSSTTVPVKISSFTGSNEGSVNTLKWRTAEEINCDYFSVERSPDNNQYISIGTKEGQGSVNHITSYVFKDHTPLPEINYYRLKQFDLDGKYEYSKVISVTGNKDKEIEILRDNDNNLLIISGSNSGYTVFLYDATGKTILSRNYNAGETARLDVSHLHSGQYLVRIITEDGKNYIKQTSIF